LSPCCPRCPWCPCPPRRTVLRSPRPVRPYLELLEERCVPVVFFVTNTDDSGPGSLRQAILDANANAGTSTLDSIQFNIPGANLHTISPLSPLPEITDDVFLDGTTQPGYNGSPLIELAGGHAGAVAARPG